MGRIREAANTNKAVNMKPNPSPAGNEFGFIKGAYGGGRYRTRTCDLPHVKRKLYQLS